MQTITDLNFRKMVNTFPEYFKPTMRYESFNDCEVCPRWKERRRPVGPIGPTNTLYVFCGRDPGEYEELNNVPFYQGSRHGRILSDFAKLMGTCREEAYITNALFCRGNDSREPTAREYLLCMWWKFNELDWRERVIFPLGRLATELFIGDQFQFRAVVNTIIAVPELHSYVVPLQHPGHVMRKDRASVLDEYALVNKLSIEVKNLVKEQYA